QTGGDEGMRAAFAPSCRLLSEKYTDTAVAFFLACRGPMIADAKALADWVVGVKAEDQKYAAIRYLARGELGPQVLRILYERGAEGTWLEDLPAGLMAAAKLSEYEQGVIKAGLGQREPAPQSEPDDSAAPPPSPPRPRPEAILQKIADW